MDWMETLVRDNLSRFHLPPTPGPNNAELQLQDFAAKTGDTEQLSRKMPVEHFTKALMATFGNIVFGIVKHYYISCLKTVESNYLWL